MTTKTFRRLGAATSATILGAGTMLLASTAPASAALPSGCTQSGTTISCTYTDDTTFAVPSGITSLSVVAVGGRGGQGYVDSALGGRAGRVTATVPITASSLVIRVGGNGQDSYRSSATRAGGRNGGGDGGHYSGGGGGASDVRTGTDLDSRILVAAGGGGGGRLERTSGGAPGQPGEDGGDTQTPGQPGTATEGGYGGGGARQGMLGTGGSGIPDNGTGGGGGGGLWGGGAGNEGGGGGGSSLVPSGGTSTVADADSEPSVTITYSTSTTPTTPTTPSAGCFGSLCL